MYDLVTIGNITVDLYFQSADFFTKDKKCCFTLGGKYIVKNFYQSIGGGAANVAIGASKLGLNTAILAKIGENEFRHIILTQLAKNTVSTEFLIFDKNFFNISLILLTKNGERTVVQYLSPNITFGLNQLIIDKLRKSNAYYIGHLPDVNLSEKISLAKIFKESGKKVIVNIGTHDTFQKSKTKLFSDYLSKVDVLICNRFEFGELIGHEGEKLFLEKDMAPYIGFQQKLLVITDAENGVFAYYLGKIYYKEAIKLEKIIDTNGAGDAFTAGFLSYYLKNQDIEKSLEKGVEYAAKILSKIGAN